jgi:hypothetical protein
MKKTKKQKTGRIGSSFDDFLFEGVTVRAIKRVLARQLIDAEEH